MFSTVLERLQKFRIEVVVRGCVYFCRVSMMSRRECEIILGDKSAAQCSNEKLKTSLNNAQARYANDQCSV